MFGAILGLAGTVIGGAMNNRAAKKGREAQAAENAANREYNAQQLQIMRADAEAAGFNPLTALRANGSGSYTTGHGGSAVGGLSNFNWVADAMGQAGNMLDPMNRRRDQLELELLEQTVRAAQGENTFRPLPAANAGLGRAEPGVVYDYRADVTRLAGAPPMMRPGQGQVSTYNTIGDNVVVPRTLANRLGLETGQQMIAGDNPEIWGEIPGEGYNAINANNLMNQSGVTSRGSVGDPAEWFQLPVLEISRGSSIRRQTR